MSAPLILAVPSKGRLEQNTAAFFARAGLDIKRQGNARNYRGTISGLAGAEVAFLSASEITNELAAGNAHLGITGEDLVREQISDPEGIIELVTPLGFGHADVVVAVPRAWIDVRALDDLADVAQNFRANQGRRLRVATKYANLTARFFSENGLSDYRIVESLGATEGAPAAGTSEIIVDITSTGSTLAANDLKVPDGAVILKSEANLVASLKADWSPLAREALSHIFDHVAAEECARAIHELRADWPAELPKGLADEISSIGGATTVASCHSQVALHVPRAALHMATSTLKNAGAVRVSVFAPNYVFEAENPLLDRLLAAIDT